MKKSLPLVTVIVVTLDNSELLSACLKSLYAQDYGMAEIIVIDNGSSEDIEGMLSEDFPGIRVKRLERNYGFAGGNNRGIKMARGKYVALINNDAVASSRWLSAMIETMENDAAIGAVASIIIDGNQPEILDSCGVGISFDGMSRQDFRGKNVLKLYQPKETLLFSGCACLLRMEALKEVGLFDEDFFAYCEDTDLGLRLRRAGWLINVAPDAYVHHYYSMTGGKFSLQKVFWVERNHFWVAAKNFPIFLLFLLPFVTCIRYLMQAFSILKGDGELNKFTKNHTTQEVISTHIKAYADVIRKLPKMISKRRRSTRILRLSDIDMLRLIWKYHLPIGEIIGMRKQ